MKANNIFPEICKNSPHLLHIHFHTWMHFLKNPGYFILPVYAFNHMWVSKQINIMAEFWVMQVLRKHTDIGTTPNQTDALIARASSP